MIRQQNDDSLTFQIIFMIESAPVSCLCRPKRLMALLVRLTSSLGMGLIQQQDMDQDGRKSLYWGLGDNQPKERLTN